MIQQILVWFLSFVLPAAVLGWAVLRWRRVSPGVHAAPWRGYLAVAATSLAALSYVLWVAASIRAPFVGGFQNWEPWLDWFTRIGFLASPAGLLTGLFGAGRLKWPALTLSAYMIIVWMVKGYFVGLEV